MLHLPGGCCDNSDPECYPRGERLIDPGYKHLGDIGDTPFYIAKQKYEFWKRPQLIIHVVDGMGATFSVEGTEDKAFLIRSRPFTDEEWAELVAGGVVQD